MLVCDRREAMSERYCHCRDGAEPVSRRGRNRSIGAPYRRIAIVPADIDSVSTFWARLLGGRVYADETFHCVLDAEGRWLLGVQRAADQEPPGWPDGKPQQVHLDLHVDDPSTAHAEAMESGATLLQAAADPDAAEEFQVYADPAGHPFCIGWGHPSDETIREQFASPADPSTPES